MRPDEAGLYAADLPDLRGGLILGVTRGKERCPFHRLRDFPLQPGDHIVYLAGDRDCADDVGLP
ncbi:MAG: TrkA C-terminal domain-containing protein [Chloroflexi bacterium]|nr:TrkA C-terminal domain-containing protein [Chloroflexota bacterium]